MEEENREDEIAEQRSQDAWEKHIEEEEFNLSKKRKDLLEHAKAFAWSLESFANRIREQDEKFIKQLKDRFSGGPTGEVDLEFINKLAGEDLSA